MEILNIIIKEMRRQDKEEKRKQREREKAHDRMIAQINKQAKQPSIRTVEDKEKIEKLKRFLAKHKVERVGC